MVGTGVDFIQCVPRPSLAGKRRKVHHLLWSMRSRSWVERGRMASWLDLRRHDARVHYGDG